MEKDLTYIKKNKKMNKHSSLGNSENFISITGIKNRKEFKNINENRNNLPLENRDR